MQRILLLAAMIVPTDAAAVAQTRPPLEEIGSWELACPASEMSKPCQLRLRAMALQAGTAAPAVALEVIHRGGQYVPMVTMRGLSTQAAVGSMLAVQTDIGLRFDSAPELRLTCRLDGRAIVCAPPPEALSAAAGELAGAHSVLVRVRLSMPGTMTLPEQARLFDLQRTMDALMRFRNTTPSDQSVPVIAGLDWHGFLDRLARDAGFANGLADVLARMEGMALGRRQ